MSKVENRIDELHIAIRQLHLVSLEETDESREGVATYLDQLFAGVGERDALRTAAREALGLYRGGMGAFPDVGTQAMSDAVERLRLALRRLV